jgi:hypothetical protein
MKRQGLAAGVLAVCLLCPQTGQAGLYSMEDPPPGETTLPKRPWEFELEQFLPYILPELMQIGNSQLDDQFKHLLGLGKEEQERLVTKATEKMSTKEERGLYRTLYKYWLLRRQYIERKDALQAKRRQGRLTQDDCINLSFYLLRLNESLDDAIGLLKSPEAQAASPHYFMVAANLATAYLRLADGSKPGDSRNLVEAMTISRQAIKNWPRQRPGWTAEQLNWYLEAEQQQLKLIRLRLREAIDKARQPPPEQAPPFDKPDALFAVNFVGDSGQFEPGKLAAAERKKLPANALAIVQQLLTWSPRDSRLYWLLGELLNTRGDEKPGDVVWAARIMDDLVKNRTLSNVRMLREHRFQLNQAAPEFARKASNLRLPDAIAGKPEAGPSRPPPEATPPQTGWQPELWQLVLVGTLGAAIIGFLAYFQIKELRRRRQRTTPGPR